MCPAHCHFSLLIRPSVRVNGILIVICRFIANVTDFGEYTCLVENDFGNASVSFPLYVWVPPSIHPLESTKHVLAGSNTTLQCDAMGFPIPNIVWEFHDEILIENTTDLSFNDIGNLFITNVSSKHEGSYACEAGNIAGNDKKFIYLHVNEPPKILDQEFLGPYLATNMDTELVISCKASGKPKPYVLWSKDGILLDNDETYKIDFDGTLTIKSPTEELSGQYVCIAKNAVGETNHTISVEIYSLLTRTQSEESHTKVTLLEGTNASVECPVPASRKDLVKWYKGAKLISEGVLQITNVSRHNTSELACVVTNMAGSAYASVSLDVEWAPAFEDKGYTDVEVVRGNDWYFDCAVDAKPRAKTKWLFNSKLIVFEDKERLKLLNVQLRHTGTYKCIVSNKHATVTRQFTLDVLVPPFISEFDLLDVQLKESTNATLECNAKGSPQPDVKWTYNNSNWQVQNSSLVSAGLTEASEGLYRCDAVNKAGTAHIVYRVSVVAAARITEVVLYNGEASTVDKVAEVVEGTSARISCKASGKPVPKIQWIRNGEAIGENDESISYADLVLKDVKLNDAGVYACVASNEGGVAEEKIRLEVLEPPKIFQTLFQDNSTVEVNLEVITGQSFYLHCHPYGNPLPEIYWFKDGLPLRLFDDSLVSSEYGEVLQARAAATTHAGNYTCVARNAIGNASLVYLLDVMVPPPIPKESAKLVTTRAGRVLQLKCPAEGSPVPAVMWLRHPYTELSDGSPRVTLLDDNFTLGSPVPAVMWLRHPYTELSDGSPRVALLDDNFTLVINNTEVSDSGKYSCIMTNKVGTTELVFDVTVEMPPSIVGNTAAQDTSVENHVVPLMRSLVLKCEVDGNPAPKVSWLKVI
ncbi:hemicentin-1-like [Ostrinia nubilalis]|uniref:hemicentin-1-like n=1 Tax=Ostrinia nubilalis TaxID=29057 RepID=UPI00308249E5